MVTNNYPPQDGRRAYPQQSTKPGSRVFVVSDLYCTKIFLGEKYFGKIWGSLLIKRNKPEHFLQKPPSIAFDLEALQVAQEIGAKDCLVINVQTGQEFHSPISRIFAKGVIFDRGYGRQIRLAMEYWSNGTDPVAEQLCLWEAV